MVHVKMLKHKEHDKKSFMFSADSDTLQSLVSYDSNDFSSNSVNSVYRN